MKFITIETQEIIDFSKSISNGSLFTKKFVHENPGKVPVFGASQYNDIPSYGYIADNLDNVKYFKNCLTWNIDGSLGCTYRNGRFALSEKVIPLYLFDKYKKIIDQNYLSVVLLQKATEMGFSRSFKPNQNRLKPLLISIPVKENGEYDITAQKKIFKEHQRIEILKQKIVHYISLLNDGSVIVNNGEIKTVMVRLLDIFTPLRGNSEYTQKYGQEHSGIYPVYSASTRTPLTYIDSFDYNGRYLTWTTNGYGGYIFILTGEFSINGDRAILIPQSDKIVLDYIKYIAQPIFRKLAKTKGRVIDGKKNEYTKLQPYMIENVHIPIPIKKDGSFDVKLQNKIAKQYQRVEILRADTIDMLKRIVNTQIKATD